MHPGRTGKAVRIIFFERTPFMSVELLDLLADYEIVCYDDDAAYRLLKRNWNLSSRRNTQLSSSIGNDESVEVMLEDKEFLGQIICGNRRSVAVTFYLNRKINRLLIAADIPMLLPPYKVQERLGNKLHLANICKMIGVPSNPALVYEKPPVVPNAMFAECRGALGLPFIVQGALGVSGDDTFVISKEYELLAAMKSLPEGFRAAKYIPNSIPLSVHACIVEHEIIVRGPFLQLLGFPELSANPFQFAGNDTNQSVLNQGAVARIREMSNRIGEYARTEGYVGILGIDYLWDQETDAVYPQELNTRLVALTRLLTGIQKDQAVLPDILIHLAAFGISSFSEKVAEMHVGEIDLSGRGYSQVIIYNNSPHDIVAVRHIEPSIYGVQDDMLQLVNSSLFLHDMEDDDALIAYAAQEGRILRPGGMLARVLLKSSVVLDREYNLKPKAVEIVELIRRQIIG